MFPADTLNEIVTPCLNCANEVLQADKSNIITCLITVTVGVIIRWIEKRKMKRSRR